MLCHDDRSDSRRRFDFISNFCFSVMTEITVPSGPPRNVTAHVSNGTSLVSVQWIEPAVWLQNGVITGYTVQYQRKTEESSQADCTVAQPLFITLDVTDAQFESDSLLGGSTYVLSVAGRTSAGAGVFSACTVIQVPSASSTSSSSGTVIGVVVGVIVGIVLVLVVVAIGYARRLRQRVNAIGAASLAQLHTDEEASPPWMTGMVAVILR
jgi:hypothetical protein